MFLFLFVASVGFAEEKGALNAELLEALHSFLSNQTEAVELVDAEGEIRPSNAIPRVGGSWQSTGAGTINGQRITAIGTGSIASFVDNDGYEVITQLTQEYQAYDANGRYIDTYRESSTMRLKITSRNFYVEDGGIRHTYSIESDTRVTQRITGRSGGNTVDFMWDYTRGGSSGSSGGGGCSTGVTTPFAALLILPLSFLFFRK